MVDHRANVVRRCVREWMSHRRQTSVQSDVGNFADALRGRAQAGRPVSRLEVRVSALASDVAGVGVRHDCLVAILQLPVDGDPLVTENAMLAVGSARGSQWELADNPARVRDAFRGPPNVTLDRHARLRLGAR